MYVIKNTETEKYVAAPGSEHSYTTKLEKARIFSARADAERELCDDNEVVVALGSITKE